VTVSKDCLELDGDILDLMAHIKSSNYRGVIMLRRYTYHNRSSHEDTSVGCDSLESPLRD
jgi:hypothetical protein